MITNKLRVILQQILRTDTLTVVKARFQSVISIEIGIELTMYMFNMYGGYIGGRIESKVSGQR